MSLYRSRFLMFLLGIWSVSCSIVAKGQTVVSLASCLPFVLGDKPELVKEHEAAGYYVTLSDGNKVFVRDQGDGSNGETIVLVHGVPTSSLLYHKMFPFLVDKGYCVIAFDFPGMGLSDKPSNRDYSWSGLAESMADLLIAQLRLQKIHLVIHDIGGPVSALFLVDNYDPYVSSVTILDTFWDATAFEPPFPMSLFLIPVIDSLTLEVGFNPCGIWLIFPIAGIVQSFDSFSLEESQSWMWLLKQGDNGDAFLEIMKGFELTQAFNDKVLNGLGTGTDFSTKVAMQIVWADGELFIPDEQREFIEENFQVERTVFVPDSRHFLQQDNPEFIAAQIDELIQMQTSE